MALPQRTHERQDLHAHRCGSWNFDSVTRSLEARNIGESRRSSGVCDGQQSFIQFVLHLG